MKIGVEQVPAEISLKNCQRLLAHIKDLALDAVLMAVDLATNLNKPLVRIGVVVDDSGRNRSRNSLEDVHLRNPLVVLGGIIATQTNSRSRLMVSQEQFV